MLILTVVAVPVAIVAVPLIIGAGQLVAAIDDEDYKSL